MRSEWQGSELVVEQLRFDVASPTLVGDAHQDMVRTIVEEISPAGASSTARVRVTVLSAPSGLGKSRIVRDVYENLRLRRGDLYWPTQSPSDATDEGADDVDATDRKRLGPDPFGITWGSKLKPTFSWWHISCDRLGTGSIASFAEMLHDQLDVHSDAVTSSVETAEGGLRVQAAQVGNFLGDVGKDYLRAQLASGAIRQVTQLAPIPQALVGVFEAAVVAAARRGNRRMKLHRDEATGAASQDASADDVRARAAAISALATPGVPAVVVVEDAHLWPDELEVFLDELTVLGAQHLHRPVHVILTAWPEGGTPAFSQWCERNRSDVRVVPPLSERELARIAKEMAKGTDDDVCLELANTILNPLLLIEWLRLAGVAEATAEGRGVTRDVMKTYSALLARDATKLYEARWDEMREDVRHALMIAADDASDQGGGLAYSPQVVERANAEVAPPIATSLGVARTQARWVRSAGGDHYAQDRNAGEVMQLRVLGEWPKAIDRGALRARSRQAALELLDTWAAAAAMDPDDAELPSGQLCVWASRLVAECASSEDPPVAAQYALGLRHYRDGDSSAAAELARALLDQIEPGERTARLRAAAAVLVVAAHQKQPVVDEETLALVEGCLREILSLPLGEADLRVVGTRHAQVSVYLGTTGEIEAFADVLAAGDLGSARDAVRVLAMIAHETYSSKGRKAAAARMASALDLARAKLGLDDPLTLDVAIDYLDFVGLDGNGAEFRQLTADLAAAARVTFGENDERTLDLCRQQLRWELKRSPSTDLAERYGELVRRVSVTLGAYSWVAITTRIEEAQAWSRSGATPKGIALIDQLITELDSVFGPTHAVARRARWMKTYQVEPGLLERLDTSVLELASPEGTSRAASADWQVIAATLERFHGAAAR